MSGCALRAWLCIVALLFTSALRAEVRASVDRNVVNLSETFELRLRVDGAMNAEEPELAPLQADFEILSTSRNHRISLMQGQRESYTDWVIVLLARRSGELRIPAITVGSETSAPVPLTVREGRASGSTPSGDISIELNADADSVHVQQQLLVTVRLLHAVNLASGATLEELEIPGAVVRKLDEGSHEEINGGRRFGVFERRYAVFPQKSGDLALPPLRFSGSSGGDSWFDRFDTGGRQYRLQSDARSIRVLPPEQGATPWIPARNLSIVETWDRDPDALRAGESATRSITLTADGLTGAQIPPIAEPDVPGLRFYADKPDVSDAASAAGLTGTRVQRVAVIPQRAGELQLPALRVRWWDTVHGRFDEAVVPARTLRVSPGAGGSATAPAPAPQAAQAIGQGAENAVSPVAPTTEAPASEVTAPPLPWIVSTLASLLLAAFFAVQWLRLRSSTRNTAPSAPTDAGDASESTAFAALERACRAGDAALAATALLRWSRAAFPASAPTSAADLGRITGDTRVAAAVDAMMASRYGAERQSWEGSALLARVSLHRPGATRGRKGDTLPALYPTGDSISV